jgi:hypothetical protein
VASGAVVVAPAREDTHFKEKGKSLWDQLPSQLATRLRGSTEDHSVPESMIFRRTESIIPFLDENDMIYCWHEGMRLDEMIEMKMNHRHARQGVGCSMQGPALHFAAASDEPQPCTE